MEGKGRMVAGTDREGGDRQPNGRADGNRKKRGYAAHLRAFKATLGTSAIMSGWFLRRIPGHEDLVKIARQRNPHKRLTVPLTEADARWKPAPERFSIAEVLAHLSHSEGHCYRMRLDRFMAETRPEFEPDDAQMYLDLYRDADPEDAFDHFEEQRENNIEFLRNLPAGAGDRLALHKEYGEITMSQMLNEWALHDLGHIRQIAELARARKYQAGAGSMAASYNLKP